MPTCNRTRKRYHRAPDITAPAATLARIESEPAPRFPAPPAIGEGDTVAWYAGGLTFLTGTVDVIGSKLAKVIVGGKPQVIDLGRLARVSPGPRTA